MFYLKGNLKNIFTGFAEFLKVIELQILTKFHKTTQNRKLLNKLNYIDLLQIVINKT